MIVLDVFPRPRKFREIGAGALASSQPTVRLDPTLPEQSYELLVSADSIEIRHGDELGLRYARHTLEQLCRQFGDRIPGLSIQDGPDTTNRAYMLDISRDRVPTMETLRWLVTVLAACRINQLQLYVEHTFAFSDHETVWADASPMTAVEMAELDGLCCSEGIELVPCLNVFGHMGPWLEHDRYRDRAECPEGFEVPVFGNHLGPLTLEPTQANAEFGLALVRELAATVSSRKVNICCDEALELGRGRTQQEVAERGKGQVFVDHLLRLVEPLIADGHDVMFWGDMFRVDPEPIARLPGADATALAWQYDPPSEPGSGISFLGAIPEVAEFFGFPEDMHLGFQSQTRQLADAGYPFWVAPGTGSWNSLIGRWPHAKANVLDAVDVGFAAGASGLLLADWGDTGHMQPLSVSVLSIAYGAAVSWGSSQNRELAIATEVDRVVFGNAGCGLGGALEVLGGLSEKCGRTAINGSAIFYDLLVEPPIPAFGKPTEDALREVEGSLEDAALALSQADLDCSQSSEIKLELQAAIGLARHGVWRMGRLVDIDHTEPVLHRDLNAAIELQEAAWLARSRPGGLPHSLGLLKTTLNTYTNSH